MKITSNDLSTILTTIASVAIPIIALIAYYVKTTLKNNTKITNCFVDHVAKQTIAVEAIRVNIEQLNRTTIEEQKRQTDAVIQALKNITNALHKHQEACKEVNASQTETLSKISSEMFKAESPKNGYTNRTK